MGETAWGIAWEREHGREQDHGRGHRESMGEHGR